MKPWRVVLLSVVCFVLGYGLGSEQTKKRYIRGYYLISVPGKYPSRFSRDMSQRDIDLARKEWSEAGFPLQ